MEKDGLVEESASEETATRRDIDFHHPYTPYPIQEEFMYTVYKVIEDGKIGILESPTGTVSKMIPFVYHVNVHLE